MQRKRRSRRKPSGLFVTFEGTEGAGKSTLIRAVAKRLEDSGFEVVLTREPGGNPLAEKIRGVILDHSMSPWTELFLYEAARAEHLDQIILPGLKSGKIVLCDRFADSSLAYQAHARGLPWKDVQAMNAVATQGLKPTLTVLLDIDPAVGLKRAQVQTRFEAEGVAFQRKVKQGFLRAKRGDPKRWHLLKMMKRGSWRTPEELAEEVILELIRRARGAGRAGRIPGETR